MMTQSRWNMNMLRLRLQMFLHMTKVNVSHKVLRKIKLSSIYLKLMTTNVIRLDNVKNPLQFFILLPFCRNIFIESRYIFLALFPL